MLFDLKGRRRRVVQVTYIGLALLMGGGLVLSGIGSDASGGLLDAFVGQGSDGDTDAGKKQFEQNIQRAQTALRANPKDQAALATLVRAHFGLAGLEQEETPEGAVSYNEEGIAQLRQAEQAWGRYLATDPKRIDTGLAATAIQLYNVLPLPQEKERLVRPAREIAEQTNTADAYINLVEVATKAGDTRTAGLAERKALSFAQSKDERATIKERIETAKTSATPTDPSAAGNGAAPPPGSP